MLAYIFWHRPNADADRDAYEAALAKFHRELAEAGSPGFLSSGAFRISETPWLDDAPGYEDWNLVDEVGALDPLNVVAVSGQMAESHGLIASMMDVGLGGLYELLEGEAHLNDRSRLIWLTRPRGIEFRPVMAELVQRAGGGVSCWRRRMVLGPAAEFLLVGDADLELEAPDEWQALTVERTRLE